MNAEHQAEILNAVRQTIKETVNGKIDRMNDKIDNYIKGDIEWKVEADKKLEVVGSVQGFGKVTLYILGFLSALGAGVGLIYKLITWLK